MKTFTYHVDGQDFTDTEAFGEAWKKAEAIAKEKHCVITRTVVSIHEEYYGHGAFLQMPEAAKEALEHAYIF